MADARARGNIRALDAVVEMHAVRACLHDHVVTAPGAACSSRRNPVVSRALQLRVLRAVTVALSSIKLCSSFWRFFQETPRRQALIRPMHTANCIINAQILHLSDCSQGQFCKLPLLRVIFNRKLGDYDAIRSIMRSGKGTADRLRGGDWRAALGEGSLRT